jgi:hypothetical protein
MTHPLVLGIVALYLIGATTLMLALKLAGIQPWGADPVLAGLTAGGALYITGSLLRPDAQGDQSRR